MKAAGLSLVSNLAAGISRRALGHEEVIAAGEAAKPRMAAFISHRASAASFRRSWPSFGWTAQ